MKAFLTVLALSVSGVLLAQPGKPAAPTFDEDGKSVVREGRIVFIHLSDDFKCYDGVRRPVMHLSYFTFTDAEKRYGLQVPRGGNKTIVMIDGKHYLPEEAQTYVANNADHGLTYRLVLIEAGKGDNPYLSWWRLDITTKPKKRD